MRNPSLEKKKVEADMMRARAALADMEVSRLERLEDIKRIEFNMEQQKEIIKTNELKLKEMTDG